jgi:hypothetical protein
VALAGAEHAGAVALRDVEVEPVAHLTEVPGPGPIAVQGVEIARDLLLGHRRVDARREQALKDQEALSLEVEPVGLGSAAERTDEHSPNEGARG